ncbi:alpha-1,2-fucosyltransferase [Flavobacterium aquidurense]|uniref:GDP-Fuc: alpha-L-fucosyltransferase-like protein Glycosyltransferase family 11 n=1 Tax=Flavobacterium aquidurense TaxID=362413 RepID=A0A0Q0SBW5_9FLAO|nr:alpha-1,2-fucosyltransferase [Flavobacterium aquidurense]KQB41579.1 GDP-Fuc: alpha-L-fucosyltransferase-like protein Glycosyltransferase family 11 [Flavobacterium aquidurense]
MITYSKIGKKGNLGNQLFQIASTIGIAVQTKQEFSFLDWKYQDYFKNKLPLLQTNFSNFKTIEEKEYSYYDRALGTDNYDIEGWLQSERYFDKQLTKYYFEFSQNLIDKLKTKYREVFQKRTILISIRRGDFVNHPDYIQLSIKYYLNSLIHFFPDWESCNLVVLSDDIKYCKFHFSFLKNAFFGDGLSEVEQLCLGTLCDDFIISNSTFSWWSAWLGEKEDSKIIRPFKNFDGLKSIELNDKDYFPERWIKYNHLNDKIILDKLVFHIRSQKNKEIIKNYILSYFDVKIAFSNTDTGSSDDIYFLEKDYFLPPFLMYSSWLALNKPHVKLVANNVAEIFKVSRGLNYEDFVVQNDLGLFSRIFDFSKAERKTKNNTLDVYLKKAGDLEQNLHFESDSEIWMHFYGIKFLSFGGYAYSIKKYTRRKKIQFKKSVKRLLLIK